MRFRRSKCLRASIICSPINSRFRVKGRGITLPNVFLLIANVYCTMQKSAKLFITTNILEIFLRFNSVSNGTDTIEAIAYK